MIRCLKKSDDLASLTASPCRRQTAGLHTGEPGNRARDLLSSVVSRRFFAGRHSPAEGKILSQLALATYLIQAPMVLQPLMFKQFLRARSHGRVLVKTLLEE